MTINCAAATLSLACLLVFKLLLPQLLGCPGFLGACLELVEASRAFIGHLSGIYRAFIGQFSGLSVLDGLLSEIFCNPINQ